VWWTRATGKWEPVSGAVKWACATEVGPTKTLLSGLFFLFGFGFGFFFFFLFSFPEERNVTKTDQLTDRLTDVPPPTNPMDGWMNGMD